MAKTVNSPLHCKKQDRGVNPFWRNLMKLGKCIVVPFCLLLTTLICFAQMNQTKQEPSQSGQRQLPTHIPMILQQEQQSPEAEKSDSPYFKGKAHFLTLRREMRESRTGSDAEPNGSGEESANQK